MNLSRRDFLKVLGVTAVGTVAGVPHAPTVADASAELSPLDAPVSPETPFAWLEIDGVRYAADSIIIDRAVVDITEHGDVARRYASMGPSSLRAALYEQIPPDLIFSGAMVSLGCAMPGRGSVFRGNAVPTNAGFVQGRDGVIMQEIRLAIIGALVTT